MSRVTSDPLNRPTRSPLTLRRSTVLLSSLSVLTVALAGAHADDSPLALTDLAEYRRALVARESEPVPPLVTYRTLWDHPAAHEGKRVQIEARIVRRFQQGSVGTFPPLVEAWAVTPLGEPICLVYPAPSSPAKADAAPGRENVRFVGTYLRRIRYAGGDVDRLAPLIVGPAPPRVPPRTARTPASVATDRAGDPLNDGLLAAVAALVVVLILGWQHLRRPVTRTSVLEPGPAPQFEESSSEDRFFSKPGQDASNDDTAVDRA